MCCVTMVTHEPHRPDLPSGEGLIRSLDPVPGTPARIRWVLLSYRLPREPSAPRVATWRRLRALGAAQISDGLVALPLDARTKEQLEWVADDVTTHGGTAAIWVAVLSTSAEERLVVEDMSAVVADSYRALLAEAHDARELPPRARRRALTRLRRELRRLRRRDYFPPPEHQLAVEAVASLAELEDEPA